MKAEILKQYHALLQADPGNSEIHHQLGLFFLKQGDYAYAKIQFENVLALNDRDQKARFHLGVSLFYLNALSEAEACFRAVLKEDPNDVEAWVNLGALSLQKGDGQHAISQFTQALLLEPDHEVATSNLAATFMHHDRHENALTHYQALHARFPEQMEYLYNLAVAEMALGLFEQAKTHFLSVLSRQPAHFAVLYNMGVLHYKLKQSKSAIHFLSEALALKPDDPNSQHLLAVLTGRQSSGTAARGYAAHLFDSYALYYEQHVCEALQYRIPMYIAGICSQLALGPALRTLDLGCGTGLCAESLRDISKALVGVDISSKMLKQARNKSIYDQLIEQDALTFLQQSNPFDLMIAADLFPYVADLTPWFKAVKKSLMPGGHFIFSVEISEAAPYQLQPTARYAHHPEHVLSLCEQSGFQVVFNELKVARQQEGQDVWVRVFAIRRRRGEGSPPSD